MEVVASTGELSHVSPSSITPLFTVAFNSSFLSLSAVILCFITMFHTKKCTSLSPLIPDINIVNSHCEEANYTCMDKVDG